MSEGFQSVSHAEPMLSLDNAYDEAELRAFDTRVRRGLADAGVVVEKVEYVTELKIDGVSMALTYEDGQFVCGATRPAQPPAREAPKRGHANQASRPAPSTPSPTRVFSQSSARVTVATTIAAAMPE